MYKRQLAVLFNLNNDFASFSLVTNYKEIRVDALFNKDFFFDAGLWELLIILKFLWIFA